LKYDSGELISAFMKLKDKIQCFDNLKEIKTDLNLINCLAAPSIEVLFPTPINYRKFSHVEV
jgi:hypothetical protein